jgi:hypothetical protein
VKLVLALLAVTAAMISSALPALAGGWAVTVLDALPDRIEVGHAYTAGYWVLQHGSHPPQFAIGDTGLKLVDENGKSLTFRGVPLAEAAHYATAFAIPHEGAWDLYGLQGVFQDYKIGAITVPGRLTILPTPAPLEIAGHEDHAWGAIHPPQVAHGDQMAGMTHPNSAPPPAASGTGGVRLSTFWPTAPLTALGLLLIAATVGLSRYRRRRPAPDRA